MGPSPWPLRFPLAVCARSSVRLVKNGVGREERGEGRGERGGVRVGRGESLKFCARLGRLTPPSACLYGLKLRWPPPHGNGAEYS